MSRRKAIEAAVNHGWEAYEDSGDSMADGMDALAGNSAARAYDLGRIAGLREAVKFNDDSLSSAVKLRTLIRRLSRRLKP